MNFQKPLSKDVLQLFLISFLTLYFELIMIRWISSEIRVFAYLKNLPLIASFLGMGLGCVWARSRIDYFRYFPVIVGILCLLVAFSGVLRITFLPFPIGDYLIVGDVTGGFDFSTLTNKFLALGKFLTTVVVIFALCVAMFLSLGQRLGQLLEAFPPISAYSINIAGSLLGVLVFSAISFAGWPPGAWFGAGFAVMIGFLPDRKRAALVFSATLAAIVAVPAKALWSPYYRIDLAPIYAAPPNTGSPIVGYNLRVNHDYFQRMLNLAEGSQDTETTQRARAYYNQIYKFVKPEKVLVVGAGSGNDVAAALRNGATQVDAVEIDPLILKLGKELHPEKPYDSPRVRLFANDARAFLKQSHEKYDLIVFGLLDSQTLLSSMSSIRLDNYIYTSESLKEARAHLKDTGTISLSFALVETWIQERFYRMMKEAFDREPLCLGTPYDAGITYLVGPTATREFVRRYPEIEATVINDRIPNQGTPLPTDDWPFLYLREKSIPFVYLFTLSTLSLLSVFWVRRVLRSAWKEPSQIETDSHSSRLLMFLLGAGFMLMEVKSISDLSLLFGSTWVVNSVVIAAILCMILLANALVIHWRPKSLGWVYLGLSCSLMASYFFKPDFLAGLDFLSKALVGGLFCSLPIFFAGILFASAFKQVGDIPQAFGANLLGALVGGMLENLSMIYGVASLNLFALGIYSLSMISVYKSEWLRLKFFRATPAAP